MQKSVLVAIDRLVKHKKYDRTLRRSTKLMVGLAVARFVLRAVQAMLPVSVCLESSVFTLLQRCIRLPLSLPWTCPTTMQAHDEGDDCGIGDTVRIRGCRPLSKNKAFVVTDVLFKARVLDSSAAAKIAAERSHSGQQASSSVGSSFAASAITSQDTTNS